MKNLLKETGILLIDDEKDIRDVLSVSLSDFGYNVTTAANGHEAMSLFRNKKFPIVLTDIKMPGMDGIELLRKIKQENSDTEVIMITGHGDTDLAIKSLKYEAIDFITKPIGDDALMIALKRVNEKIINRQLLRDYTQKLENLLREKTELQDHLSSLGVMIGSISHGLKGLLTRLDGGVYLIDSALSQREYNEIDEGLDIVKQTVVRIKKMVLDILYYAKERNLNLESVNVFGFFDDVAKIIEHKINGSEIEFVREFNLEHGDFEIDAEFLHSALVNILDNAVDACREDTAKKPHKIVFGVKENAGNIIFEVTDNGIGMDNKQKENIFNLFYSSKGKKGTGFGLFIVDNIIKQHKGTINVNSAKNKGTHFTIRIPQKYNDKD